MSRAASGSVHPREDDDADIINETILAFSMTEKETVGCAYYVALDETLSLQEDIPMAGLELIETLLLHAQPTTVIVTNRAPERLIEYLENRARGCEERQGDGMNGLFVLRIVGNAEFNYDASKDRLLNLDFELLGPQSTTLTSVAEDEVDGDDANVAGSKQGRLMRLATHINLESRLSVACAGAILNEVQRRKASKYLPDDPDVNFAYRVKQIATFTLSNSMFINADTIAALQILGSEAHPNTQMQGPVASKSGAKENLSVYGLVKPLACTPQGKLRLRQIFLRPSVDLDVIHERHKTIAILLRPENSSVTSSIVKMLRKVKNARMPMLYLRKGVDRSSRLKLAKNNVWMGLLRFAQVSIELREAISTLAGGEGLAIVSKIVNEVEFGEMAQVGEMINAVIDFALSEESNHTAVKRGFNAELDDLKHKYDGLGSFLSIVADRVGQSVPEWARQYIKSCIFYPQLGFLTMVSADPDTGRPNYEGEGVINDKWEPMFSNEGSIYFKNAMMTQLDEEVGDIYGMILDKEIEIIHELSVNVLKYEPGILAASDLFGELDSLVALAVGAERYRWTAPRMTTQNLINIEGGRHPLQELAVAAFIANDCALRGGCGNNSEEAMDMSEVEDESQGPSMLIMTGPNHSGKSVYLKQVALIVYMAHIGSYVPAEQATIGITDRILTRIATRESVAINESAFSIDLKQIAFSINFATHRSLVLIDEFGKGTNAYNGTGLMTAVLDHFLLALGDERPKVLVATHFHEIFENGFLPENSALSFAHMDVKMNTDVADPEEQVTYLFRKVPGRSVASLGSHCAAMNGVDRAVVERADALSLLLARNEDLQAACAKLSKDEEASLEKAELVARSFVELDIPEVTRSKAGERGKSGEIGIMRNMIRELMSPLSRGSSSF